MKALILEAYHRLVYKDVSEPECGPDDVLVQVKACGICGSDVHGLDGSTGRRIPPLIMGHEASGLVVETGANVEKFAESDRVTFDSTVYCGHCYFCRQGEINLCNNRQVLGVSCEEYRKNGAFAEYVSIPQHILYPLPEGINFERAAMVEPVSVAFHAVGLTPLSLNDTAVVVGAGMIGLLVVQTLRLAGCGKIIAVDIETRKLGMAKQLGADEGLNATEVDVPSTIKELTEGHGADLTIEVVGSTVTLQTAILSVKKGGKVTLIGNQNPQVELPLQTVVTRQIRIQGSCASNGEYPACLDMIASGRINVDALMSRIAPFQKAPNGFGSYIIMKEN